MTIAKQENFKVVQDLVELKQDCASFLQSLRDRQFQSDVKFIIELRIE